VNPARPWAALLAAGLAILAAVACARTEPAHSTDSSELLWADEFRRLEKESWRLWDQRDLQESLRGFRMAEAVWHEERTRLQQEAARCPGSKQPLAPSGAGPLRDGIRIRAATELDFLPSLPEERFAKMRAHRHLLDAVHHLSLVDWSVRRAASTQDAAHCERARQFLARADESMRSAQDEASVAAREGNVPER
jgi:hypothetical protein